MRIRRASERPLETMKRAAEWLCCIPDWVVVAFRALFLWPRSGGFSPRLVSRKAVSAPRRDPGVGGGISFVVATLIAYIWGGYT